MKSILTEALPPANAGDNLLDQIDQLWKAAHLFSPDLSKVLDQLYDKISMVGVDANAAQRTKALADHINTIRKAQTSIQQLSASGFPAELLGKVSTTDLTEKAEALLEAQRALREPGHLADRLQKYNENMEKAGALDDEEKRSNLKFLESVEALYEFLSKMEFIRETSELLRETVQIDALDALYSKARWVRRAYQQLMAVGDTPTLETRLNNFITSVIQLSGKK